MFYLFVAVGTWNKANKAKQLSTQL